jgi:sec-independent protein translocase protein TatC
VATRTKRGAGPDGKMSLGKHLIELRNRLFIAAIAIALGSVAGWFLSDFVFDAIRAPILQIAAQQGRNASLNFTDITSAFDLKIQISITAGIFISSPIWLYQVWAFLVPGLTRKEKLYGVGFLGAAIPLFFAGCVAGWFVLPHIVVLLTGFAPAQDTALITARGYYDFILKLVLAVGIAFILPVFIVLLNFVGVLSAQAIIKAWRVALIVIVLFTAIATPAADVMSMLLLAVPMVVLYFAAYGVAWLHDRHTARVAANLSPPLAA